MSEKLPYEEQLRQQLEELPLPDENRSWELMQQKLDEGKRRRLPPVWLQNCAGWGLLLLLLSGAAWYFFGKENEKEEGRPVVTTNTKDAPPAGSTADAPAGIYNSNPPANTAPPVSNEVTGDAAKKETAAMSDPAETGKIQTVTGAHRENRSVVKRNGSDDAIIPNDKHESLAAERNKPANGTGQTQKALAKDRIDNKSRDGVAGAESLVKEGQSAEKMKVENGKEIVHTNEDRKQDAVKEEVAPKAADAVTAPAGNEGSIGIDSSLKKKDSAAIHPTTDSTLKKAKPQKLYVSAGIGEQQQIPLGDQETVPYDYYGRKSSLSDYIPSVYLRLHKENKWFLQAEFRYGAPQSVKDFSYSQQSAYNSFSNELTTRTVHLRKTYYHQLPLSFNYFVLPNLSIGGGAMYSHFYGAVTEEEIKSQDLLTQQETVTRKIVNIKSFNDSFLYKTQVHLLLQADYHWKRFSFGLRYARDVQPYIKYTRPDGSIHTEKNHSLQAFIRFRVWDSR